jgi:hypothetical protein
VNDLVGYGKMKIYQLNHKENFLKKNLSLTPEELGRSYRSLGRASDPQPAKICGNENGKQQSSLHTLLLIHRKSV